MTCESRVTHDPPPHRTITHITALAPMRSDIAALSTMTPRPWVTTHPLNQGSGAMGSERPTGSGGPHPPQFSRPAGMGERVPPPARVLNFPKKFQWELEGFKWSLTFLKRARKTRTGGHAWSLFGFKWSPRAPRVVQRCIQFSGNISTEQPFLMNRSRASFVPGDWPSQNPAMVRALAANSTAMSSLRLGPAEMP